MKKQKILKYLIILVSTILAICLIYNIVKAVQTGNQTVYVSTSNNYYIDTDLEAIVEITSQKIIEDGKIKVKLLDSEEKGIKGVKEKYELSENSTSNITLKIPENLEPGKYYLEVTATTNLGKDKVKKAINIQNNKDENINVTFDKGIYKPGDTVNFRALLTYKDNDKPIEEDINISIYDGNDNRVYNKSSKTSAYGIISGSFNLADEVNSGNYKLTVTTKGQEYSKYFTVNPYVTPKYGVEIVTDKDNYLVGEKANITIKTSYFFGEKVNNANVNLKIEKEEFKGQTDANGEFKIEYEVKNPGKINISTTVVDTSNYMVEEAKTISVGTDIFEIEVLPVYGNIINSIDNEIYIFTKKADGTGIKTYLTVNVGKIKRQVITDENGIGKVQLTASDISNIITADNQVELKITAQDMENNQVSKNVKIYSQNNYGTVISTDKVKYNVGEDIEVKINSIDNSEKTIYISKNDKVIKMITTTDEEISLNLEDTYGLVDINVINTRNQYDYYVYNYSHNRNINTKRTIFIKPDKELNINIEADSDEYKPGDTATLKFNLSDEENKKVDGAMLISILDEAILNLASNDISIDNIKLALSDIKFTEDLDAATLYTNIIDDSSETTLMGILLKQSNSDNLVSKTACYSDIRQYEYEQRSILLGIALVVILGIVGYIKSKKIRLVVGHTLALTAIVIILLSSLYEFLYYETDLEEISVFILVAISSIILYVLFFYKNKKYLLKFLLQYFVIIVLADVIISVISEYTSLYRDTAILITLLILPVLYTIVILADRAGKKVSKLKEILQTALKCEIIFTITWLIFKEYFVLPTLILDCIYKKVLRKNKDEKDENEEKEKNRKATILEIGIQVILGIIIGITPLFIVIYIFSLSSGLMQNSMGSIQQAPSMSDSWNNGIIDMNAATGSVGSTNKGPSSFGDILNSADSFLSSGNKESESIDTAQKENEFVEEKESTEDENIRNVFLESLCFIPELITENGSANKEIKLSDNITTWQIQVVGNTKEGQVGYASDTFKVFKEFFVDFSMPTNSVVGDKVSLPITIFNYTENNLTVSLNIPEQKWMKLGEYSKVISLGAKETKMIYLPIEILTSGENKLRVEAKANELTDIIERTMKTEENGIKISNVVASGTFEDKLELDVLYLQNYKPGTGSLKVKLYGTAMSQAVEGLENIFRMPTGCFEQVSSSLYPDILVLNYLEQTDNINEELRKKALNYIETGYQKILTYEVSSEKGGYSLYGHAPAELVLTAYGLMEIKDLSEVYDVDEKVLENMKKYILDKQNSNGSFNLERQYTHGVVNTSNELALNAYIIWALTESFPEEKALKKSVEYLEEKIDEVTDNYTMALMANVFANTNSKKTNTVINKLVKNIQKQGDNICYLTSNIKDYYGSYGRYQNIQTTALTSMALTKVNSNSKTNLKLINYIISQKDVYGTWGTTQATILALKALIEYEGNTTISEQEIEISLNKNKKNIKVEKDNLDVYQVNFEEVEKENKLKIELEKGKLYYEVIQEYYVDYENYDKENSFNLEYTIDTDVKVNDFIKQKIKISNTSKEEIANGMLEISIPQACSVKEESLSKLQTYGVIEKYEYSYDKIYLYIRNLKQNDFIDVDIEYKADYPASILGGVVRVYDYYNPDIEAIAMPTSIIIK